MPRNLSLECYVMEMGEAMQVHFLQLHCQPKEIEELSQLRIRIPVCGKSCQRLGRVPEIAIGLGY
jgi:hypothetical protein